METWLERMARLGLATKGVVYGVIGALAILAAFGAGGRTTGSEGAIREIGRQPFGKLLLAIVAAGLLGYALWRIGQGLLDTDRAGRDLRGVSLRAGFIGIGLVHIGLAASAVRVLLGERTGGDRTRVWTARLMAEPAGEWLVGLLGAAVVGAGLYQLYAGLRCRFEQRLETGRMSARQRTWARRAGLLGLVARGIVFSLVGAFLIHAARTERPREAHGLGGALAELARQPYGPWLLGVVAFGLVAYGVYCGVEARFRRPGYLAQTRSTG